MNLRSIATQIESMLISQGIAMKKMSVHQHEFLLMAHFADGTHIELNMGKMLQTAIKSEVDAIIKSKKPVEKTTKIVKKSDK